MQFEGVVSKTGSTSLCLLSFTLHASAGLLISTDPNFCKKLLRADIRLLPTPSGIQNLAHDDFEDASQLADLVALGLLSIF